MVRHGELGNRDERLLCTCAPQCSYMYVVACMLTAMISLAWCICAELWLVVHT